MELSYQSLVVTLAEVAADIEKFSREGRGIHLRQYQVDAARTVIRSVIRSEGLSIVVMFPRQSGKNELQARIEAYLLTLLSGNEAEIVKISPTWKPQSQNAMRRLERVLKGNAITAPMWRKEQGYMYRLENARITFLSGSPETNIVGATASTLLEVDEAQDVLVEKFDREIAPMAASTNATRVFWGTAWTSTTLLARELRLSRQAEEADGVRRVFCLGANEVAAEVPAYGHFVRGQVERLGRNHPAVKSQFYSEEIESECGMFPPQRLALLAGSHPRLDQPEQDRNYAFLLDTAGEDENASATAFEAIGLASPGRDATALTVVEVDTQAAGSRLDRRPVYRVVARRLWVGVRHTRLYEQILALAETWRAWRVVADATGVGAGLASFLERALPGRLEAFTFNSSTKSHLGWAFLSLVETGRFKDWQRSAGIFGEAGGWQEEFYAQMAACQMEVLPGPERRLKWGVPDGKRDPASGDFLHDDLVISAALAAALDGAGWPLSGKTAAVIAGKDPLKEMDFGF